MRAEQHTQVPAGDRPGSTASHCHRPAASSTSTAASQPPLLAELPEVDEIEQSGHRSRKHRSHRPKSDGRLVPAWLSTKLVGGAIAVLVLAAIIPIGIGRMFGSKPADNDRPAWHPGVPAPNAADAPAWSPGMPSTASATGAGATGFPAPQTVLGGAQADPAQMPSAVSPPQNFPWPENRPGSADGPAPNIVIPAPSAMFPAPAPQAPPAAQHTPGPSVPEHVYPRSYAAAQSDRGFGPQGVAYPTAPISPPASMTQRDYRAEYSRTDRPEPGVAQLEGIIEKPPVRYGYDGTRPGVH